MDPAPENNAARVNALLESMLATKNTQEDTHGRHSVVGSVFLEGFAYDDREGAYDELCCLLKKSDKAVQLLRCADWAPIELKGSVMCWWAEHNVAYMVSPSGRVINWRKANSSGVYDKLKDCVLHTYAATRLNEEWLRGMERKCSRI